MCPFVLYALLKATASQRASDSVAAVFGGRGSSEPMSYNKERERERERETLITVMSGI